MTPELSALLVRARDDSTSFDAEERQRFNSLMWGLFNLFEDSFIQRTNGLLTRESWESTRWAMADMLSSPGVRDWVQRNRPGLTPALQEEIAILISGTDD